MISRRAFAPRPLDRPDVRRGRLGGRCDGEDPARRPAAPDEGGAHRGGPQRVRGIPGGGDRSGERGLGRATSLEGPASPRTSSSTASTRSTCRRRPRSTAPPALARRAREFDATTSSARSATRSRSTSQPASRAIWVEVRARPDAKPGSFGNVTVTTDAGEAQIPVASRCGTSSCRRRRPEDALRPVVGLIPNGHGVSPEGDADIRHRYAALGLDHRISPPASPTTATTGTSTTSIATTARSSTVPRRRGFLARSSRR